MLALDLVEFLGGGDIAFCGQRIDAGVIDLLDRALYVLLRFGVGAGGDGQYGEARRGEARQ